ncbi:MAG TPA: hypothetical protein DD670_17905 [Planctomycetaceae bacterium]|nr:hypothetical protein [Planctomycetaceae bacterium]
MASRRSAAEGNLELIGEQVVALPVFEINHADFDGHQIGGQHLPRLHLFETAASQPRGGPVDRVAGSGPTEFVLSSRDSF